MVTEVRTIIGDCSVTIEVAAFITTMSLPASVGDVGGAERLGRQREAGEDVDAVAHDELLREALGDVGVRAAGVLADDLDLLAGDLVAVLGDVELDAGVELVRRVGEGARVGQDDADLHGVLGDGAPGPGQAEAERDGGCGPCGHADFLPVVAAGVRPGGALPAKVTHARRLKPRGMRTAG